MKFLSRLRATKNEETVSGSQEPRLRGETDPVDSVSARDAFVNVLTKGSAVYQPRLSVSCIDSALDLENAVEVAALHCNDELERRMVVFRDAAIELSMGGGSEEDVKAACEHFISGCRLALGTND